VDGKQALTIALASGRVAFGLGLVAAPARIGSSWLGPDGERQATHVALRGLGARDIALAAGAAWASARGSAVRPWLVATVGGDLSDIAATLAAGDSLPGRARTGTLLLAGVSALACAGLAAAVDS
jgi:hypothetical protein